MTWLRALPVLAVAGAFDLLRLIFEQFWLFGPALAGTAAGAWLSQYVGDFLAGIAGAITAGASGFFLFAAFETFGIVMAIAVGFAGWLAIAIILSVFNHRIFKVDGGAVLSMLFGLLITEAPILGSIPCITIVTWRLYRIQIRKDKEAHKRWQAQVAQARQEDRAESAAHLARENQAREAQRREIPEAAEAAA
jgi:hypothetical protein